VLPGSRQGEVARHAPVFAEVARALRTADPDLAVIVPAATSVAERIARAFPPDPTGWPRILDPRGQSADDAEARKWAIFGAADAALAASGTVSLELAAAGTPQVVAYRTSALTAAIVRRLLRVDTVTLVNLVTETRAIPEFLQDSCSADRIVPALRDLLGDPAAAARQIAAADRAMALLGRGGDPPGVRAARSVLAQIRS
jgi:lipid-A-disaccharide synthase